MSLLRTFLDHIHEWSFYLGLLRLQLPPGGQSVIMRLVHDARQTGRSDVARNVGSYK